MNALTKAAQDVLAERQRQIEREGWNERHDDQHSTGDMARAAAAYCLNESDVPVLARLVEADRPIWPWALCWWKPKDRRRNLVRAAALLLAEIERMDRAALGVAPTAKERAAEYADWFLYGAEALNVAQECGAFRYLQKAPSDPPSYIRFTDAQLAAFVARIRTAGVTGRVPRPGPWPDPPAAQAVRGVFDAAPALCRNCGKTWSQHDGAGRCPDGVDVPATGDKP